MVKDCKKRATCEICSKKHPSLLHSKRDENTDQENARPEKGSTSGHSTPQEDASAKSEVTAVTGAGGNDCILSIVRIKSKRSNTAIETYAFMDSGSSATFCSERLMRRLGVHGKKTQVLLWARRSPCPATCSQI